MQYRIQTSLAAIAIAACCATAALAQTASPAPGHFQGMRGMHRQIVQIETQTRAQMVNALTPANRTLLANVAGQLAIAPNPDLRASAQQLDAALSSSEKQAIINADSSARTQIRTVFQNARARAQGPGAGPMPSHPPMGAPQRARRAPDAGMLLLRHALMIIGPRHV